MFALTPRNIGAKLNLDEIQFFVDVCNAQIINQDPFTTILLPSFKAIAVSMNIEMKHTLPPYEETTRKVILGPQERTYIENLFNKAGWFTTFTTREFIKESLQHLNVESVDILTNILNSTPEEYTGPLFLLTTLKFGSPEESMVPKPLPEEEVQQILDNEAKTQ